MDRLFRDEAPAAGRPREEPIIPIPVFDPPAPEERILAGDAEGGPYPGGLQSRGAIVSPPADDESEPRRQVGALPFRIGRDGTHRILLVTSRESRRWVIPKGWPMKGRKPFQAAAREAYEEAGLRGTVGRRPLGYYLYEKRLKTFEAVLCQVKVFPLQVRKQLKRFPEQHQRESRWFSPLEAAEAVSEPGLAAIIRAASRQPAQHLVPSASGAASSVVRKP